MSDYAAEVVSADDDRLEVAADNWFVRQAPPGAMLRLTKAGYHVRVKAWEPDPTPQGTRIVEIEPL